MTELLAPPSFLKGVLELEGWSRLQHVWDGVPAIAAEIAETQGSLDWDTLRLSTHRMLTQFPFGPTLLPPGAKTLLINLLHRRLDASLEAVARARVHRQAYEVGAPVRPKHGAFGPMQVMKAIEQHVVGLQEAGNLPALTKAIFGRINGDDNLELLSRLHGEIARTALPTMWPILLEWVMALSWHNDPADLCRMDIDMLMGSHDSVQLIHDTIRGDPPLKVAEAAVRLAERHPDTAVVPSLASLLAGRYPNHLKRNIAMALTAVGDSTAIAHLVRIILAETADLSDDQHPFWRVRATAMQAAALIATRDPVQVDIVVPALRQVLHRETFSIPSRLQAITLLARHFGIKEGFELASQEVVESAAREYAETRDLAAEALAAIGNSLALNPLMEALQHVNRVNTNLERMRGFGADNPAALLAALASFGMPMHWNAGAQRWVKGLEQLHGPQTVLPVSPPTGTQ